MRRSRRRATCSGTYSATGPPNEAIRKTPYDQKPYWELERARIGNSRKVPLELVVNGLPVAKQEIEADGKMRPVSFDARVERSSWVALRILPSSHTNPVFVLAQGQGVRAADGVVEGPGALDDQAAPVAVGLEPAAGDEDRTEHDRRDRQLR